MCLQLLHHALRLSVPTPTTQRPRYYKASLEASLISRHFRRRIDTMQSVFQTSPLTPIALYRPTLDTAVASETQDRPQLEVSIDVSHSCHPLPLSSLPGTPPGHGMVTPSPTSASAYSNSPASTYSHPVTPLLYGRCPTGSPPESASPLEADILSSMPGPSRRQGRRSSLPSSPLDDGLVIQGTNIVHPYARLYNKKNGAGKRRKMWNHALEKALFTPEEM